MGAITRRNVQVIEVKVIVPFVREFGLKNSYKNFCTRLSHFRFRAHNRMLGNDNRSPEHVQQVWSRCDWAAREAGRMLWHDNVYPNADLYEQVIKVTSCYMKLKSDHNSLSPSGLAMWRKTSSDNCLMGKEEKARKKDEGWRLSSWRLPIPRFNSMSIEQNISRKGQKISSAESVKKQMAVHDINIVNRRKRSNITGVLSFIHHHMKISEKNLSDRPSERSLVWRKKTVKQVIVNGLQLQIFTSAKFDTETFFSFHHKSFE